MESPGNDVVKGCCLLTPISKGWFRHPAFATLRQWAAFAEHDEVVGFRVGK